MALVAVLWIVSLLALLAAGVGSSSRVSGKLAFNAIENAKARALAEAGVNRALYHLLTGEAYRLPSLDGAFSLSFATEDGWVAVQVRDEDGKIDLNAAPVELLTGLLGSVGVEGEGGARAMAERIVDYRDEDDEPLPSGAEDPAYAAAGLGHGAADRPFRQPDELKSVLGMTDVLYQRLQPHVTVYADAEGFDFLRASDPVLAALPGVSPDVLTIIRSVGIEGDLYSMIPEDVIGPIEGYMLASRELIYQIRALGQTREDGRFLLEAVIALDGGRGRLPFTTYEWRRGALNANDPLRGMMQRVMSSP